MKWNPWKPKSHLLKYNFLLLMRVHATNKIFFHPSSLHDKKKILKSIYHSSRARITRVWKLLSQFLLLDDIRKRREIFMQVWWRPRKIVCQKNCGEVNSSTVVGNFPGSFLALRHQHKQILCKLLFIKKITLEVECGCNFNPDDIMKCLRRL